MSETTWKNRVRITGKIKTLSPLHVGDGRIVHAPEFNRKAHQAHQAHRKDSDSEFPIDILGLVRGSENRVYLPGSSLRGWFRQAAFATLPDKTELLETWFGTAKQTDAAIAGNIEFHDSFFQPSASTAILTSVAIDRKTRTAKERFLAHWEVIEPGQECDILITSQNLAGDDLATFLGLLNCLNGSSPDSSLGGRTGRGWGRCQWHLESIEELTKEQVNDWWEEETVTTPPFTAVEAKPAKLTRPSPYTLELRLTIKCSGLFLVNDPFRVKQQENAEDEIATDHLPRLGPDGRALLPGTSLAGALRSQSERILRTITGKELSEKTPANTLLNLLYGTTETASCLKVPDTSAEPPPSPVKEGFTIDRATDGGTDDSKIKNTSAEPLEFLVKEGIAIDRFTGGGVDGLKFNSEAAVSPTFHLALHLDTRPLATKNLTLPALGLLVLTLRDLQEGDIPLGFGVFRGYGACRAEINSLHLHHLTDELEYLFMEHEIEVPAPSELTANPDLPKKPILVSLVQHLTEHLELQNV